MVAGTSSPPDAHIQIRTQVEKENGQGHTRRPKPVTGFAIILRI